MSPRRKINQSSSYSSIPTIPKLFLWSIFLVYILNCKYDNLITSTIQVQAHEGLHTTGIQRPQSIDDHITDNRFQRLRKRQLTSTNSDTGDDFFDDEETGDDFFEDNDDGHFGKLHLPTDSFEMRFNAESKPTDSQAHDILVSLKQLLELALLKRTFYAGGESTDSYHPEDGSGADLGLVETTLEVYSIQMLNLRNVEFIANEPMQSTPSVNIRVQGILFFLDFPESNSRKLMTASSVDDKIKLSIRDSIMSAVQSTVNNQSSSKKLQDIYHLDLNGSGSSSHTSSSNPWNLKLAWSHQGFSLAPVPAPPVPSPPTYSTTQPPVSDDPKQRIDPITQIEVPSSSKSTENILISVFSVLTITSLVSFLLVKRHRHRLRVEFESTQHHEDFNGTTEIGGLDPNLNDSFESVADTRELKGLDLVTHDSKVGSFFRKLVSARSSHRYQSRTVTQTMGNDIEFENIDDGAFPTMPNVHIRDTDYNRNSPAALRSGTPTSGDGSRTIESSPDSQGMEITISSGQSDDGVSSLGGSEKDHGYNTSAIELYNNLCPPELSNRPTMIQTTSQTNGIIRADGKLFIDDDEPIVSPRNQFLPANLLPARDDTQAPPNTTGAVVTTAIETTMLRRQDSLSYSDSSASESISIPATMLLESQSASEDEVENEAQNEDDDILNFSDSDSGLGALLDEAYGQVGTNGPSLDDISAVSPTSTEQGGQMDYDHHGNNQEFNSDDKSLPSVV